MSIFVNLLLNKTGKDMFVKIYTFTNEKSTSINDALFLKKTLYNCYLSNDGSFVIYNKNIGTGSSGTKTDVEYINTFTKKPVLINSGLPPLSLNIKVIDQKYFFSPNSKWILYKNVSNNVISYYILYNTFQFIDFKNYYSVNGNESTSINLFKKYCKEVNNLDDGCLCFNFDDNPACLYDLIGQTDTDTLKNKIDTASKQFYNTLSSGCPCVNQNCSKFSKQNADSATFIPYYIQKNLNNCNQDFILSYCNSSITAGRDLTSEGKVTVNQACSAQGATIGGDTTGGGTTGGGTTGGGTTGGGTTGGGTTGGGTTGGGTTGGGTTGGGTTGGGTTGGGTTSGGTTGGGTTSGDTTGGGTTGGGTTSGDTTGGGTTGGSNSKDIQKYLIISVSIIFVIILIIIIIRNINKKS